MIGKDGSDELFSEFEKANTGYTIKMWILNQLRIEQFSGWENNLLVVNTSRSFDEVKST